MAKRAARGRAGATFAGLLALFELDPKNHLHGYDKARLKRAFGRYPLRAITEERITDYGLAREKTGTSAPLINGELEVLGRILDWAHASGRLAVVPKIWFVRKEPIERRHPFLPGSGGSMFSRASAWKTLAMASMPPRPPGQPERPAKRGKLSAEALAEHLKSYPRGHRKPDGSLLTISERVRLLAAKGIVIHRTTLTKRFGPARHKTTP